MVFNTFATSGLPRRVKLPHVSQVKIVQYSSSVVKGLRGALTKEVVLPPIQGLFST